MSGGPDSLPDDLDGIDDEDGVVFQDSITPGSQAGRPLRNIAAAHELGSG